MKPYSDIESDEAHSDRSSGLESGASDGEWTLLEYNKFYSLYYYHLHSFACTPFVIIVY